MVCGQTEKKRKKFYLFVWKDLKLQNITCIGVKRKIKDKLLKTQRWVIFINASVWKRKSKISYSKLKDKLYL